MRFLERTGKILGNTVKGLGVLSALGGIIYGAHAIGRTTNSYIDSKNLAFYSDINDDGLRDMIIQTPVKYKVFLQDKEGNYTFTNESELVKRASELFR